MSIHLSPYVRKEGAPCLAQLAVPGNFLVFELAARRLLVREAAWLRRLFTRLPSPQQWLSAIPLLVARRFC